MEPDLEGDGGRESKRFPTWAKVLVALGGLCLLAIVGLGLAATLVVPAIAREIGATECSKATADIASLGRAADDYAVRNDGRYPDELEVLVVPDVNGATFLGRTSLPLDPWGSAYGYEPPPAGEARPRIFTLGADGQQGGAGDDRDIDSEMIRKGEI